MIISKSVRLLSLSLAVAGFFPTLSFAQNGAPADKPAKETPPVHVDQLDAFKGYGGLALGSEFSAAKGLELEQDRGALKIYKKKDANLTLGPVLLDEVLYYFYDGKLCGVALHTDDGQDTLNLRTVLTLAFGRGFPSASGGPSTVWMGKTNGAVFELNTSTGDGNAYLFDIKLHDAFLKYESEAAQKAADQLVKGE